MSLVTERPSNAQFTTELFQYNRESWNGVKNDILGIEKACFGNLSYSEQNFIDDFEKSDTIVVFLRSPQGKIIGYTYTIPRGTSTVNIESTAIDPEYQGRGLVEKLMRTLEEELRRRAIDFLTRDSAISNGYADKIQKHYGQRVVEWRDHTSKYGPQRFFKIRI